MLLFKIYISCSLLEGPALAGAAVTGEAVPDTVLIFGTDKVLK
jgi:hypothetical protein